MKRTLLWCLVAIVAALKLLPWITLIWIAVGYNRFGAITQQVCSGNTWWEDTANCAAQFALEKNDPRYCRIDLFGEVGDLCSTLYAERTTDVSTCHQIDLLAAQRKCLMRFQ